MTKQIRGILFENWDEPKFVYNSFLGRTQLIPKFTDKIRNYVSLRNLASECVNKKTGIIDILLLKSFILQFSFKKSFYAVQNKYKFTTLQ
jgi:hypothetical protein